MGEMSYSFTVTRDEDLREDLRKFYIDIALKNKEIKPIKITIKSTIWISAYGLNILMTFIAALRYKFSNYPIHIHLLDTEVINDVLSGRIFEDKKKYDDKSIGYLVKKLIFYESMEIYKNLRRFNVIESPNKEIFDDMQGILKAKKQKRYNKYSSKMLPLSPLIQSEEEQYSLVSRMRTMTNILYKNLYGKIDFDLATESASQIMFELVKNIYQHAYDKNKGPKTIKGFACAQINQYPLLGFAPFNKSIFESLLNSIRKKSVRKKYEFLSISVSDFGFGLIKIVEEDLLNRLNSNQGDLIIGRHHISPTTLVDKSSLMEIAVTTDFSTKLVRKTQDTYQTSGNSAVRLADHGYGLVFCLSFIARLFGRILIRSCGYELSIVATPDAAYNINLCGSTNNISKLKKEQFNKYFIVHHKKIKSENNSSFFPGTQLLIEVPVETFINR